MGETWGQQKKKNINTGNKLTNPFIPSQVLHMSILNTEHLLPGI